MIDALAPVKLGDGNLPIVNNLTMKTSHNKVWCGGDLAGLAETTVEAVNDGKTAAWFIHCHLEVSKIKQSLQKKTKCSFNRDYLTPHHQNYHCFTQKLTRQIYRWKCVELNLKIRLVWLPLRQQRALQ